MTNERIAEVRRKPHHNLTVEETLDLLAEVEAAKRMRDVLNNLRWKSIDKDNMKFQCTVTCYEMDAIDKALATPAEKGEGS